jgi:quercetin dioxygenase-like cupin family protein
MRVRQGHGLCAVQNAPRANTDAERHDPRPARGRCAAINAASARSDIILQTRATRPGSFEAFRCHGLAPSTILSKRRRPETRSPPEERRGIKMNEIDFEAKLRADGYTEIETQDLQPRPAKGQHGHPFSIRGLVLAGTFIVTQDNQRTIHKPGEVFAVAQGHPHDESIGPEGARVLVGRKYEPSADL